MAMENTNIFNLEATSENFGKLYKQVRAGNSCSIFGVQNSARPAIVSGFDKKILYITADNVTASAIQENFELMGKKVFVFPAVQDSFLYKRAMSTELYEQRTRALYNILNKSFDVIVAPIEALYAYLPSIEDFSSHILKLKTNQTIEPEILEKKLVEAGYKREELISENGQFSRRGEVFDVYPVGTKEPYRIDFFDNLIETIKVFDIATQKGTKQVDQIKICPYSDLFLTDDEIEKLKFDVNKLRKNETADVDANTIFNSGLDEIISRLDLKDRSYALDALSPYLDDFRASIFDYFEKSLSGEYLVVLDECKQLFDSMKSYSSEFAERIKELRDSGTLLAGKRSCSFSTEDVLKNFQSKTAIAFLKITNSNKFFNSKAVFNFKTLASNRYTHNLKEFSVDVRGYIAKGYKVFVFAGDGDQAHNAENILKSHDIEIEINKKATIADKKSAILTAGYSTGFVLPEEKIVVVGTYDVFPKKRQSSSLKLAKTNVFSVPKVGDYVVHQYHGIGVCEGITQLTGNLGTKDYVVIRYRDGDRLYVPTSHMDMLDRFSGADEPKKLSKIGGQDFSAVKNKVRDSIKKLAFSLVELYAKREQIRGFAFSEDNDLQREFENAFPFTETEDQLSSAFEIKKDMESSKVMDRLLCGDVGFGKTEVALRAIFKAVMDGKQVAFVAPTTILSEQHYNTARARMYDFGINIEVLNRFKTKNQTEKILNDLKLGKVDLLCGTHRILSKDVEFKDLGLIVLDEEQKFGVEDKEKLKNKYPNVDVLTLSATPIPRTLNMSLTGIRDISIIATPPSERLPIQTYITEYSESLIKDAITREMNRDGQVFILFNSVEKIYTYAERVRRLVPDAKIAVAHGQMPARELENIIYDFYHRKADVLICTTIIENGIDIENANTLIVYDADKLGLSQLYQIRGRVGRGSRMAYAYFTYEYSKVLSEEAYKRLDAMSEFCEFGSGFKLAMRDLEIRGGGNILGAEQSGHLQKIGYDMYARMLADAVKEAKGEEVQEKKDVLVKVALDAYVPDTYVSTSEERMIVYKRISTVDSVESVEKLKIELNQTYGKIPNEVLSLISISLVRQLASKIGAIEVVSSGAEVDIVFEKPEDITSNNVIGETIYKFRMNCAIDLSQKPMIKFNKERLCRDNFDVLQKFLLTSSDIIKKDLTKN